MRNRMRSKKRFKVKYILIILFLFAGISVVVDLVRISNYEIIPMRPVEKIDLQQDQVYYDLVNGVDSIDWNRLDGTLEYISNEYDCSDFRLVNLVRILYEYGDQIPKEYKTKIEDVLFGFRYWWDEPGENSMCYWSENHQVLFASAEYLIGKKYPHVVFKNSGLTGKQHMEKARKCALDWLEMRWKYGFTEFYSGVYYKEDIAALINLIDFAGDKELAQKSKIIMDLLFYDVAAQNINTMFVSASGRAYKGNRTGEGGSTLGGLTSYYWGDGKECGAGMLYGMMTTLKYKLPPVLAEIAKDSSNVIIQQSNGLDISELKTEGYYGTDNRSMMMQWGMECFTNPEIVRNTLAHIRNCNMFSNAFIGDFKMLDFSLLKWLRLEPVVTRVINPQPNGVAIQKGNTYTYKTKDYSLYTAQAYHPGTYGDQQHIFGMNINNHFSIFHNHPALEKDRNFQSPNYWVGYGHIPHSVQDKNVNLSIYNIPEKKGLMEMDLLDYTRAYFPTGEFDTAYIDQTFVFGKKGETYCAFIGANVFNFRDNTKNDIIQKGKQTFWITEAGSKTEDGSFGEFVERIKKNTVDFNPVTLELNYRSNNTRYHLKFGADFIVNGKIIDTAYSRYNSPYAQARKKDKTITFNHGGKSLFLDFYKQIREFE
ncbi:hypothetical protein OU798_00845 [Prolixibacteraceae bacterium Z1-6]|uniref:Heparinase n=1 Tax=Draconibacterium aestuarii TaxID=2998507 RepID=A0A9X3F302_9BACT|nr:hypothetical protein [Prolixibacteraceae bacterium Z1-6]